MHAEVTRHLLERVKLVGNIVCINLPSEHIVFVTHPFYATCLYLPLNHFEVLLITFSMNIQFLNKLQRMQFGGYGLADQRLI